MPKGKRLEGKLEGTDEILTHEEVLKILSEQARLGSVSAATALERALRARGAGEENEVDSAISRILTKS